MRTLYSGTEFADNETYSSDWHITEQRDRQHVLCKNSVLENITHINLVQ